MPTSAWRPGTLEAEHLRTSAPKYRYVRRCVCECECAWQPHFCVSPGLHSILNEGSQELERYWMLVSARLDANARLIYLLSRGNNSGSYKYLATQNVTM
jgi:hypothetical protein